MRSNTNATAPQSRVFVTSECHPGARLQRAIAAGNLTAAEQAAFELPFIPVADAGALVDLYAEKGDRKFERAALSTSAGTWTRRTRRRCGPGRRLAGGAEADLNQTGKVGVDGMLVCLECGCSSDERAQGWTAFLAEDPEGEESPFIGVFCPVCAASEFKYPPERAADYT